MSSNNSKIYQCGLGPKTFTNNVVCALQKRDECTAASKTTNDWVKCTIDFMKEVDEAKTQTLSSAKTGNEQP